jgi:PilZ domain
LFTVLAHEYRYITGLMPPGTRMLFNQMGRSNVSESYLRKSMRIPVSYRGTIRDGQMARKCLIQDMSSTGMFVVSTAPYKPGEILRLECDMGEGRSLACKVEVRHCDDDMCMGVKIVEIITQSAGGFQHRVEGEGAVENSPQVAG